MRTAAIALLFANAIDTATLIVAFLLFPDTGVEANPITLLLWSRYGLLLTAAIKMGLVVLVATWGLTTRTNHRRLGVSLLAAGTLSGALGALTNLAVIVALIGVN